MENTLKKMSRRTEPTMGGSPTGNWEKIKQNFCYEIFNKAPIEDEIEDVKSKDKCLFPKYHVRIL
jgi:hypothetical protein